MDTNKKGDKSVAIIMAKLVEYEYIVLLPFGDNKRYDLAVDIGNKIIRIQCKTARVRGDVIKFKTCSVVKGEGGKYFTTKYSASDIDYFMVYAPELHKIYILTPEDKFEVYLHITEPKHKDPKVRMAKAFEFSGVFS